MGLNYTKEDVESMALCAWKEARGEGDDGMRAVLCVIHNRSRKWYGGLNAGVVQVVMARNQFTSMSVPSDPEFHLKPHPGDKQYEFCLAEAQNVLDGFVKDVTNGALYYYNPKTATSGWFVDHIVNDPDEHPMSAKIGKQEFYR